MRYLTNKEKIADFMRIFGRAAKSDCRVYFTGGVTAVLMGWRDSTVDIDLKFEPERDELFRALPEIKERLAINVELASPPDFIPEVPGWHDRSLFIGREGNVDYWNYDTYSQALSKIERGHDQDISDVESMVATGLVEPKKLLVLFTSIEPDLFRYPAIKPQVFKNAVERITNK
jgi:hypothetical protein